MAVHVPPDPPSMVLELRGRPEGGDGEVIARIELAGGRAPTLEVVARGETETHVATTRIRGWCPRRDLRAWCRAVLAATREGW